MRAPPMSRRTLDAERRSGPLGEVEVTIADLVSPLKLARLRAGWSQVELARRSRRSRSLIAAAEVGALSRPLAAHLAKVLDVPVEQLLVRAR